MTRVFFSSTLVGCFMYALTMSATHAASAVIGSPITIYADRSLGEPTLKQGFLHGIRYQKGKDYSRTISLISALKPKSWRISYYENVYTFVVDEGKFPQRFGTKITYNVQDVFHRIYGQRIAIDPRCSGRQRDCFGSYADFKTTWVKVVDQGMKRATSNRITIDYYDIFSEPTSVLKGIAPEQLGDLFKTTYEIIRRYKPDAKIVGPSLISFQPKLLEEFLKYVAANDIRLAAVSWHEFGSPVQVPQHVNHIRDVFKRIPKLCDPTCPEIHINEYEPSEQHLVAGFGVGWLYYLEKAKVDGANRACWGEPNDAYQSCWTGINGMLMSDDVTPQPLYWVYKAYADMTGVRISSETSNPAIVAIAARDDTKNELRILTGKYGAVAPVTIVVNGYPYDGDAADVEISRIPNIGNVPRALPNPPAPERKRLRLEGKTLSITIDNFGSGEAYSIVVKGAR